LSKETSATIITAILVIAIMGFIIMELPQIDAVVSAAR
tara:strand:- start:374 stop:487 length:114 start_codon:yes stop_codon:yes gene_type:complete